MTFGEKLQMLRARRGLSQDALAEALEVSRQAVSRWERNETLPETEKVIRLSRYFSVTTDYLLLDEVQSPTGNGGNKRSPRGGAGHVVLTPRLAAGRGTGSAGRRVVAAADHRRLALHQHAGRGEPHLVPGCRTVWICLFGSDCVGCWSDHSGGSERILGPQAAGETAVVSSGMDGGGLEASAAWRPRLLRALRGL